MSARFIAFLEKPYAIAAWGFFAFLALGAIVALGGGADLYAGADSDDLMRLARVRDWMEGQAGWYAMDAPRLGWGGVTMLPWSRLVDVPLAALAFPLKPFIGLTGALEVAGFILPLLLLAFAAMPVAAAMTRGFIPRHQRWLGAVLVFALGGPLLAQLAPARVDHHAYQILIAGATFALLIRLLLKPRKEAAILAAGLFACGFWIGGEALPPFILFISLLCIAGVWRRGETARVCAVFGAALIGALLLVWPLARPVWAGDDFALTWFSGAYVLFGCLTGGVALGVGAVRSLPLPLRIVGAGLAALIAGVLFFVLVPTASLGPYADLPDTSARIILPHVAEAQPLVSKITSNLEPRALLFWFGVLTGPLIAWGASWWAVIVGRRRLIAFVSALYLTFFLMGALFWQFRLFFFAQIFAIPFLARTLVRGGNGLAPTCQTRAAFWRRAGFFLALTFAPTSLLPAFLTTRPVYPDDVFFLFRPRVDVCGRQAVWRALNDLPQGKRIATTLNDGAGVVFYTKHKASAAPYGVPTNQASLDFFAAPDDETALLIAQEQKFDYVVLCRKVPTFYLASTAPLGLALDENGSLQSTAPTNRESLAERIVRGRIPRWLAPVEGFEKTETMLLRVVPERETL